MLPTYRIAIGLALFSASLAHGSNLIVSGTLDGLFTSATCTTTPCPGWTAANNNVWNYGTPSQASYVKFAPYGQFSAWLDGPAVSIAQLQFQNARYWGSGSQPQDDPTALYTALLKVQIQFSNPSIPKAEYAWDLNVSAVRNGVDTVYHLPTSPAPYNFTVAGQTYSFNLLGFYVGNTQVSELTSTQWGYASAELRANVTPGPKVSPTPEPAMAFLLPPAIAALFWLRRKRRTA